MPTINYTIASILIYLLATTGFDVLVSILQTKKEIIFVLRTSIISSYTHPLSSLFLAIPFLFIGLVASNIAKGIGPPQAKIYFAISNLALGTLYFSGYWSAQKALLANEWTSAALSIGLLPFQSILVLALAALPTGFMLLRSIRSKPN